MNAELKRAFREGFEEGWTVFWSPFVGLYKALAHVWRMHLGVGLWRCDAKFAGRERSVAMDADLKRAFREGFEEGWTTFWSPFVALYKALAHTWRTHLGAGE
jgi:hypothetical protein